MENVQLLQVGLKNNILSRNCAKLKNYQQIFQILETTQR